MLAAWRRRSSRRRVYSASAMMAFFGFAAASLAISIAVYGPAIVAKNVIGVLVGILKMPAVTIPAIAKGRSPPSFSGGSPLGVELMGEDGFRDVFFGSADGTQLHAAEDDGSRRVVGKRPIVFVHGFPELWISWRSQLSKFAAAGHPVLALSMRGYGLSDKPSDIAAFDTALLTQDIRAAVGSNARLSIVLAAGHVNSVQLCAVNRYSTVNNPFRRLLLQDPKVINRCSWHTIGVQASVGHSLLILEAKRWYVLQDCICLNCFGRHED